MNETAARHRARRAAGAAVAMAAALAAVGCGSGTAAGRTAASDPPLFVPWHRVGDIAFGESRAKVEREYGSPGHGFHVLQRYGDHVQGYYRLHGGRVVVTFFGDVVGEIGFSTRYHRTKDGFGVGVGSAIPLGPCHRTAAGRCERRWHGFVFDAWSKGAPCSCWVKVGTGTQSLRATSANFGKPWLFIYTRRGRVSEFYLSSRYTD